MNKSVLLLIAASICISNIFAQTLNTTENAYKYWYYRDRLKYFVMPGTEPGQSILFSRRNQTFVQWDGTPYTMDIDQPRMMMGFYIGMLATEYKLLKDNGQIASASETLIELNLALDALVRMDKCEDDIPWYYNYEAMDGFFIREDIPAVLPTEMENYFNIHLDPSLSSFDQALVQPGLPTIIKGNHVRSTRRFEDGNSIFSLNPTWEEDWQNYWTDNSKYWEYWKRQKFVSQDELVGMLMGLALVVKCVDDQPTKDKAIDIGGKSVSFTLGNGPFSFSQLLDVFSGNSVMGMFSTAWLYMS